MSFPKYYIILLVHDPLNFSFEIKYFDVSKSLYLSQKLKSKHKHKKKIKQKYVYRAQNIHELIKAH